MNEKSADSQRKWMTRVLSFILGALILCIFATIQKKAIGAPLVVTGYVVPFLFGGVTGLMIALWDAKLRDSWKALQKANDELETKVRERTDDLEKAIAGLEESEGRFRSIFHQSPIAIEIYDNKGSLVTVNSACLKLFGVQSIQEIQGFNLFADPNLPVPQKEILQSGHTVCYQTVFDFEKVKALKLYRTSREGVIWIEVLITPVGDPLQEYLVQIQDITDRKLGEIALQESEARWKFALEGSGDGVWDWNAVTNQVFFSKQWKTMLGYDENEIGDTLDEWDLRVHPDDKSTVMADIHAHLRGETTVYQNEHRVLCKDGSYKWILDRGKIIERTEDGKPLRIIGTHADISERKKAEAERENLIAGLEDAMANVKQLSGLLPICSHCKKIRDDKGYWNQIEHYLHQHSEAVFSHGICQECAKKYYPDLDIYDD